MLYTVAICMLIAMLLSGMLLLYSYAKLDNDRIYFQELARDNMESGKNLILYAKQADFGHYAAALWDSPIDSYYVDTQPWGLYGLLIAEGVHGPARTRQALLYGERPQGIYAASLYLEDRSRALNLSGETKIQGKIYLPEAGLKRGFVGRTGFRGTHLSNGPKALSKGLPSKPDFDRCKDARNTLRNLAAHKILGNWAIQVGDSVQGDWEEKTILIQSGNPIEILDAQLSGNIKIIAPFVFIGQRSQIQDIQIYANSVHIEDGFNGRLQVFTTDSIYVGRNCTLGYPSALVLASENPLSEIYLDEDSKLEGLVLSDANFIHDNVRSEGLVTISKNTEVIGNVCVAENLDLKGIVTGNIVTGKFRLRTESSIYDNYLLDATIQHQGLSTNYAMPLLQKGKQELQEICVLKSK